MQSFESFVLFGCSSKFSILHHHSLFQCSGKPCCVSMQLLLHHEMLFLLQSWLTKLVGWTKRECWFFSPITILQSDKNAHKFSTGELWVQENCLFHVCFLKTKILWLCSREQPFSSASEVALCFSGDFYTKSPLKFSFFFFLWTMALHSCQIVLSVTVNNG